MMLKMVTSSLRQEQVLLGKHERENVFVRVSYTA